MRWHRCINQDFGNIKNIGRHRFLDRYNHHKKKRKINGCT